MTLVVYHKISDHLHCDDGFCSAFIFWLKYGYAAEYVPAMYHQKPSLDTFRGRDVFIVDFCYSKDELDEIQSVAASLVVLDHQNSALFLQNSWFAHIDTAKSSCELTWEFLFPDQPMPLLVQQIRDHTLGVTDDKYTRPFIARLRSLPYTFDAWNEIHSVLSSRSSEEYRDFVIRGMAFLEGHDVQCSQLAAAATPLTLRGVSGLAVNAPKFFAKDVGLELARRSGTFGAVYFFREDGRVQFELHSETFDVEHLASSHYAGGGHAAYAGFAVSTLEFQAMLDPSFEQLSLYSHIESRLSTYTYSGTPNVCALRNDVERHINFGRPVNLDIAITLKYRRSFGDIVLRCLRFPVDLFVVMPFVSNKPAWYHKFFYDRTQKLEFDDAQIAALLRSSKSCDVRTDTLVEDLTKTVKWKYSARLRRPACTAVVSVRLPDTGVTFSKTLDI